MLHHLLHLQLPMPSNLSFSKLPPEAPSYRFATTTGTIGVLEIAKVVRWWQGDAQAETNLCRRGLVRVSIRRVSDLLVSLCWKSDSLSSCDHDESFVASHIAFVVFSVVVVIVLGRHRQRTSRPGAVIGGSRLVSALTLLHVSLVQAASAGVRVLLAP